MNKYIARFSNLEGRLKDFTKILKRIRRDIKKHNGKNANNLFAFELSETSSIYINNTMLCCYANLDTMKNCGIIGFEIDKRSDKFKINIQKKFLTACKVYGTDKIMSLAASPNPDNNKLCFELIKHVKNQF